jgi:hypothetical protein
VLVAAIISPSREQSKSDGALSRHRLTASAAIAVALLARRSGCSPRMYPQGSSSTE